MPASITRSISSERQNDEKDCSNHPDRNRHVLCGDAGVAHLTDNGRDEVRDGARAEIHDKEQREDIGPGVGKGGLDGLPVREFGPVSNSCGIAVVHHADGGKLSFFEGEALGRLREVEEDELE